MNQKLTMARYLAGIAALLSVFLPGSFVFAKSMYVIANINNDPTPVQTYDIQGAPNYLVFQAEQIEAVSKRSKARTWSSLFAT